MPPRTIGPYEVLSIVGRGGIGTVYRARHRKSGQEMALKLLAPPPACDPTAARRLAREFEALQNLHHPNVVRVYEAGVYEGYSFLAMELVEGLDLRRYLSPLIDEASNQKDIFCGPIEDPAFDLPPPWSEPDTGTACLGAEAIRDFAAMMDEPETDPGSKPGERVAEVNRAGPPVAEPCPLSPALAERLNRPCRLLRLKDALLQVCEGLAYVHDRGLVHRDLKPSNIMVDDRRRVKIMDFGLVKIAADAVHLTQHGKVVGTYRYMAPEQARGEVVDERADLYSLGVILFELLCGTPPFMARHPAELWKEIVSHPPPGVLALNPGTDPVLARLAEQLLAKDPRERCQSAREIALNLSRDGSWGS
ncbi:MAG TPA: serine/threonine-protein kinase [Anaeromyxobacteraceae bacterium]|nr:serine/threonine-protein kinase [Anaeromyxobacteraceae bacterium]